jgi:BirA family biotin operon repressor/biotin-[acetyl-CoA-carboxylase] ligase
MITEGILTLLKREKKPASGGLNAGFLSSSLNLPLHSIYEGIEELRRMGYKIETQRGKGFKLLSVPDALIPLEIMENLKTKILGREIFSYRSLKSTNDLAYRLAEEKVPEGTLILAERQTAGKGRMGRRWYSPPEKGIWMSLILRPDIPPAKAPGLSLCTSLALAQTIKEKTGLGAKLKWPNDCLIEGKKVAGILLELSAELDRVNFVIIGVGINVNQSQKDFPRNLRGKATSLYRESGEKLPRVELLKSFLKNLEKIYINFKTFGLKYYHEEIKKYSTLLGKKVKLLYGKEKLKGRVVDIDENGSLVLETRKGKKIITAGEVTLI